MIKLPDARTTKIQFLAARKFPEVYPWPNRRLNPNQTSLLELQSGARQYVKELSGKSDSELAREYETEKRKAAEEARAKAEDEEALRPSNQPFARANANWPAVQQLLNESRFASEYAGRREIATRAKAMGQLWDFTIPFIFLASAERMEFPVAACWQ